MAVRAASSKLGEAKVSPVKVSEVAQLLGKSAFHPAYFQDMSEKQEKEATQTTVIKDGKYHPDGSLGKLKARLVGV